MIGACFASAQKKKKRTTIAPESDVHRMRVTTPVAVATVGDPNGVMMATETGRRRAVTVNATMAVPPVSATELETIPVAVAPASGRNAVPMTTATGARDLVTVSAEINRTMRYTAVNGEMIMPSEAVNAEMIMPSEVVDGEMTMPSATTIELGSVPVAVAREE